MGLHRCSGNNEGAGCLQDAVEPCTGLLGDALEEKRPLMGSQKRPPPRVHRVGWAWTGGLHHWVLASADTPPGEGAIRMGQRYHCHNKCYTLGAAVGVMSFGKLHQSQDLLTWSYGLVARP